MKSDPLPNLPSAAEDSAAALRIASRSGFLRRQRPWLRSSSPRRAARARTASRGRELRAETSAGGYLVVMLCLLLAGCGISSSEPTSEPSASSGEASSGSSPAPSSSSAPQDSPSGSPTSRPSGEPAGTKIITADSDFGRMLYDASGQPIYLFDAETTSRPECYGSVRRPGRRC